jgi:membrane fusion protein, multidrug efflux system
MALLKQVLTFLAVAAIAGGTYAVMRNGPQSPAPEAARGRSGGGPISVVVDQAHRADVPVYLEGVGSAKARNSVVVRPQVDGRLISIKFKEGQDVKKGDLLAQIDPVTYQAQLDQALAKKAIDESLLATAERDLARYEKVGTLAVTEKAIDAQRGLVAQQQAQIKSDSASIDNLTAILEYTNIKAPIDGRAGIRNIDEGNLVRAGDTNGIVTITEVRPISVLFTLPQQQLPVLSKALANAALTVDAFTTDSTTLLDTGKLQVVDNQVDPQTGTIRIKADFPNEKLQLWPGQFVNVRLLVDTLKDVVVVPAASVQRGPNGTFVYVAGTDETVALRQIKVRQQDEKVAVIADGVNAGDKVVTSGFGRLEDGAKVRVNSAPPPDADKPAGGATNPGPQTGAINSAPAFAAEATPPADAGVIKPEAESAPDATPKKERRKHRDKGQGRSDGAGAPP